MGLFFLEDGRQDIPHVHLGFFRGTGMIHGPLNDPLEPGRLLEDILAALRYALQAFIEKTGQLTFQVVNIPAAVPDDLDSEIIVQNRIEYMLHANMIMASFFGFPHCKSECRAKFFTDHGYSSSIVHFSGKPFSSANRETVSTLVSATS